MPTEGLHMMCWVPRLKRVGGWSAVSCQKSNAWSLQHSSHCNTSDQCTDHIRGCTGSMHVVQGIRPPATVNTWL
jgi:hypothetical protein